MWSLSCGTNWLFSPVFAEARVSEKKKKKPEGHSLQVVTLGGAGMEAVAGGDEHTTPDRKI